MSEMATNCDEFTKFVLLIEEHKDILIKSQAKAEKQKKDEAVSAILPKWKEISGKELTQMSLLKKLNKIKSRAKSASISNKPLSDCWQRKILEITVSF